MRFLELKIPPPLVALLICVAMWFAARLGPMLEVPLAVRIAALVVLALAGGALAWSGDVAFKRAKTTINPLKPQNATALVTSGVYRYTRNPMYVGLALVVLGWTAFLGSAVALLGLVVFVAYITRFQIMPEERALSAKFGADYSGYTSRVRRWLCLTKPDLLLEPERRVHLDPIGRRRRVGSADGAGPQEGSRRPGNT